MKRFIKVQSILLILIMTLSLIFNNVDMNVLAAKDKETNVTEEQKEENVVEEPKIVEELTEKRTENTKYFLKEDGSTEVAVYKDQIHYEENGQWKEIDNTLKSTTTETEDNKKIDAIGSENGDLKFNFAKDSNAEKLVSIEKEGYELSWNLEGSKKKQLEEKKKDKNEEKKQVDELIKEAVDTTINNDKKYENITEENKKEVKEVLTYNENVKTLENNSNTINYSDILDDVTLQYIQGTTSLKENLIINKKIDTKKFQFNITAKGLKPELNEDNTISFYTDNEEKKEIYLLNSPYMIDAKGETSTEIKVDIEGEEGKYTLSITPSKNG